MAQQQTGQEPTLDVDEMTVVERLERLQDIAGRLQEHHLPDEMVDGHELAHGLGNAVRDLKKVIEDDARDCTHCGSPFTFRRSDGDIGCKDCHGIMPREYRCAGCGASGPRHDLKNDPCEWYDDGNHELEVDTRICLACGEQGTPHELQTHTCAGTDGNPLHRDYKRSSDDQQDDSTTPDDPDINVGACPDCGSLDTEWRRVKSRAGFDDSPLQEQGRVVRCNTCDGEKLVIQADVVEGL